jgi:hypothetical protein
MTSIAFVIVPNTDSSTPRKAAVAVFLTIVAAHHRKEQGIAAMASINQAFAVVVPIVVVPIVHHIIFLLLFRGLFPSFGALVVVSDFHSGALQVAAVAIVFPVGSASHGEKQRIAVVATRNHSFAVVPVSIVVTREVIFTLVRVFFPSFGALVVVIDFHSGALQVAAVAIVFPVGSASHGEKQRIAVVATRNHSFAVVPRSRSNLVVSRFVWTRSFLRIVNTSNHQHSDKSQCTKQLAKIQHVFSLQT